MSVSQSQSATSTKIEANKMAHIPFDYANAHVVVGCVQIIAPCSKLTFEFGADMLASRVALQIRLHDALCDTSSATPGDSNAMIEVWYGAIVATDEGFLLPSMLLPANVPDQTINWARSFTAGQSVSIAIGSAAAPISGMLQVTAS